MRLNEYEKDARREIDQWLQSQSSPGMQAMDMVSRPFDWVLGQVAPEKTIDRCSNAIGAFLNTLSDASKWTYDYASVIRAAERDGMKVETVEALRDEPLARLDPLAQRRLSENALLAAIEGGGTGLGGAALIAADIPLLFTINLRLLQQIAASYGFPMREPEYRSLVLGIYNAAAAGNQQAKNDAMREISVAAAVFAQDGSYRGRAPSNTLRDQARNLPREIAKSLVERKLAQTIPLAGALVGAGVNYWFTSEVSKTTRMLCRALYLEHKERRED